MRTQLLPPVPRTVKDARVRFGAKRAAAYHQPMKPDCALYPDPLCRPLPRRRGGILLGATASLLLLSACDRVPPELVRHMPDGLPGAQIVSRLPIDMTRMILIIGGILLVLAGWRLHRFVLALPGFTVGALVGAILMRFTGESLAVALALILILGAIGAAISLSLFRTAVVVIGGVGGFLAANALWTAATGVPQVVALLIGAAAGALLLLWLMRVWLPILSSFLGAAMIAYALQLGLPWLVGVFALGLLVQSGAARALGRNAFSTTLLDTRR
jgi:hypothetical protein